MAADFLVLLATTLVISTSGVMMPGPLFAAAVAKGHGDRLAGIWVALGHAVIEVPVILLVAYGATTFLQDKWTQAFVGTFGAALLAVMAREMIRLGARGVPPEAGGGKAALARHPLVAGVVTTSANPYFFLWWATIGAVLVMAALGLGMLAVVAFAIVHWSTDLAWLTFISYTVHRTKRLWTDRTYKAVFWGCGALLLIFAAWFACSAVLAIS